DRKCIDGFIQDVNCLYLFDRGYYNYSWYDELTRNGINFVTRQTSNACVEEVNSRYTGIDNMYDYDVVLGSDYSKNKTEFIYREILIFDKYEKEVRFL
ncbi:transposase, partial [Acinetobacter baumannii]|nr:transposase [Acinetobacter baumannii]